jgi:hypothetical protein
LQGRSRSLGDSRLDHVLRLCVYEVVVCGHRDGTGNTHLAEGVDSSASFR